MGKDLNRQFFKEDVHMAKKHMKRCSTSLIMREMQIKTVMRYHLMRLQMPITKKPRNTCWRGCREKWTLIYCWWECNCCSHHRKQHGDSSKKLKIELPYNPAILFLCIYPKNTKSLIPKDLCTPMFMEALFTIAKTWKQPKWPLMDEWIKKMWDTYMYTHIYIHTHTHTHTMVYYSAIKKDEILPFATTWMELEIYYAKWNKSDGESQMPYDFTHMWKIIKTTNRHRPREQIGVSQRGMGEGRGQRRKGAHMFGDRWQLDFWWWTRCSLYRSRNIMMYT